MGVVAVMMICSGVALRPSNAVAYDRKAAWNSTYDPKFPVIPVYGCPGRFATYFPSFPWTNILYQALLAANEWFLGGGAHLRHRYEGDLANNDARCVNEAPDNGTVLISAEQNNGSFFCYAATTIYLYDMAHVMYKATLILHSGTKCAPDRHYEAYNWATNANYPQANQLDFQSVFLHEFGHTLGLDHSSVSGAVMFADAVLGDVTKRKLHNDDVTALTGPGAYPAYTTTSLNLFNAWTSNLGSTWQLNVNGPSTNYAIGSPVACIDNDAPSSSYFGAYTDASRTSIRTFTWSSSGYASGTSFSVASNMPPSVACGNGNKKFIGWIDSTSGYIKYVVYNGSTWSTTYTLAYQSAIAPAVKQFYKPSSGGPAGYVLAFADLGTGKLRTLTSADAVTWTSLQNWDSIRTFLPANWGCIPTTNICTFSWADGNVYNTLPMIISFYTPQGGPLSISGGPAVLSGNSYGGGMDYNNSQPLFVWRDRGTQTLLTSTPYTFGTPNYSSFITHGPPNSVWSKYYGTFASWYSYNASYNNW